MNDKERVELIMKIYNLTPSQFADRAGIQRASVSHILSGRNKPSLEVMLKIYESFPGLDMAWLMTGKGVAPEPQAPQGVAEEQLPLSMPELFTQPENGAVVSPVATPAPVVQKPQKPVVQRPVATERAPRRSSARTAQADAAPSVRRIKEIRIFYTDGTYETMFPEK